MCLADRAALSQKPSTALHPLPSYCGACQDIGKLYLRDIDTLIENPLSGQYLGQAILKCREDALRPLTASRFFLSELVKQHTSAFQQSVRLFEVFRFLVGRINQGVAQLPRPLRVQSTPARTSSLPVCGL